MQYMLLLDEVSSSSQQTNRTGLKRSNSGRPSSGSDCITNSGKFWNGPEGCNDARDSSSGDTVRATSAWAAATDSAVSANQTTTISNLTKVVISDRRTIASAFIAVFVTVESGC